VPGGWLFDFVDPQFPRGDCTLVVFPVPVASTVPPCSGPTVLSLTARCSPFLWFLRGLCREADLWLPCLVLTPGQLWVPVMRTLQRIRHIYQCQLKWSTSEGVGVGGSTTIRGISRGFAVSAAAGACPSVAWVAQQSCPSHQQRISVSQLNQEWAPQYLVQLFPNTGSSSSKPPPYAAASVQ